ncbi:DUF5615 family PIN-like protein [Kitasatospora sp. NPDC094028]
MVKRFHKHKLLLDEQMPTRSSFPRVNEHFDVKHVAEDLHKDSSSDDHVYDLAVTLGRIILTRNTKHFIKLAGTKADAGVIGIPPHWQPKQIDSQLTALLMKHTPSHFSGRYTPLSEKETSA